MKADIKDRKDIELLVNTFYDRVKENKVIGFIFNDVAKVDWQQHLPIMYSFWATLLLGEQSYAGNPMARHIELSHLTPLTEVQFNEWMHLFNETVDELFEGSVAAFAKNKALNIARLMLTKIEGSENGLI